MLQNNSKSKIVISLIVTVLAIWLSLSNVLENNSFINSPKLRLGLDLSGGSEILLKIDVEGYLSDKMNNIAKELKLLFKKEKIKAFPRIKAQNEKSNDKAIEFKIKNIDNKKLVFDIIRKVDSKLHIVEKDKKFNITIPNSYESIIKSQLIQQSIKIVRKRIDETGLVDPSIQVQGKDGILVQIPGVEDSEQLKKMLGKTAKLAFHMISTNPKEDNLLILSGYKNNSQYFVEKEILLSGEMLIDANVVYYQGKPAVSFKFNSTGSRKFAEVTSKNIGRILAIVLDDKVVTAPKINTIINEGSGVITGDFQVSEATEVAILLKSGALPTSLLVVEERLIGSALGADSIRSGILASIVGLIFVMLFVLFEYGYQGMIANISLVVCMFTVIGTLSLFEATLTLPGIAGLVLTFGMAVDANVLVFERIKEERASSKSALKLINNSFDTASRTIMDSNITTLIVAIILWKFGSGPVKSFAIVLAIGIMSSVFSAVIVSKELMIAIFGNHVINPITDTKRSLSVFSKKPATAFRK